MNATRGLVEQAHHRVSSRERGGMSGTKDQLAVVGPLNRLVESAERAAREYNARSLHPSLKQPDGKTDAWAGVIA